jgi:hypothetical protein
VSRIEVKGGYQEIFIASNTKRIVHLFCLDLPVMVTKYKRDITNTKTNGRHRIWAS